MLREYSEPKASRNVLVIAREVLEKSSFDQMQSCQLSFIDIYESYITSLISREILREDRVKYQG